MRGWIFRDRLDQRILPCAFQESVSAIILPIIVIPYHFSYFHIPPSVDEQASYQLTNFQFSPYEFLDLNEKFPKMAGRLWVFWLIKVPFAELEELLRFHVGFIPCRLHSFDLNSFPTITNKIVHGWWKMVRSFVALLENSL